MQRPAPSILASRASLGALPALLALASCNFDPSVTGAAQVLCAHDGDCPAAQQCTRGQCFPNGVAIPVAMSADVAVDEDRQVDIALVATGVDPKATTFAVTSAPQIGKLVCADGVLVCSDGCAQLSACRVPSTGLVYRPNPNANGADSFTFTAAPTAYPRLVSDAATISIAVAPVNDPPTATAPDAVDVEQGGTVAVRLSGEDVDGDALSLEIFDVSQGSVDAATNTLVAMPGGALVVHYTAPQDFVGDAQISYAVHDAVSQSATVTATIHVAPVLRAVPPASVIVDEDQSVTITLGGEGAANLDFVVTGDPAHGSLTRLAGASFRYAPAPDYNGDDSFDYAVTSGSARSPSVTVPITVNPVNDPPSCPPASAGVLEDTAGDIALSASDIDSPQVTFNFDPIPLQLFSSVTVTNTTLHYVTVPNAFGVEHIPLTCSDGEAVVSTDLVVTVSNVPDAPIALGIATPQHLDEDTVGLATLTAVDLDGDPVRFAITRQPAHGAADVLATFTDGIVARYQPSPDYNGPDSFGFTVFDDVEGVQSSEADVELFVDPVNDPPVIDVTPLTIREDEPVKDLLIHVTDVDGDATTVGFAGQPTHGTLTVVDASTLRYTRLGSAAFLDDNLTVTASDGKATTIASVPLQVTSFPSCALIQAHELNASTGVHVIDADPPGGTDRYLAHCNMDTAGGGWTLALRIDGRHQKFVFGGSLWTSTALLNSDEPDFPGANDDEVKLASYLGVDTGEVLLGMATFKPNAGPDFSAVHFVRGQLTSVFPSLRAAFGNGSPVPFDASTSSPSSFISALPGSTVGAQCSAAGLDVGGPSALVRIGIAGAAVSCPVQNEIGVGASGSPTAGAIDTTPTAASTAAFVGVWVRSRDFSALGDATSCLEHQQNGAVLTGTYLVNGVATTCDFGTAFEAICGDGVVQPPEQCDDGVDSPTDPACDQRCKVPVCGDGFVSGTEQCDDGNTIDTDACSNACTVNGT